MYGAQVASRSSRGSRGRKAAQPPCSSGPAGEPLAALLRAYELGQEAPLLRRAVCAALAGAGLGPRAALLFAHASMGATMQQQYALAASARMAAARRPDNQGGAKALEAALGTVLARLEAPRLDVGALLADTGAAKPGKGRRGGGASRSAKAEAADSTAQALLSRLEVQAGEALGALGEALLSAGSFPVVGLLPLRGHSRTGESLMLSRWTPGSDAPPVLVELPLPAGEDGQLQVRLPAARGQGPSAGPEHRPQPTFAD